MTGTNHLLLCGESSRQEGVPSSGVCDWMKNHIKRYLRRGGRVYVRRHASDDVVEDDVIAGGVFLFLFLVLTVVSGFLIDEICVGTGVLIFSQ